MAPSPDTLSAIAGYMSLASWIVVYTPQIWENYQLKSGEGLSVLFIVFWLLGDVTGMIGGMLAHLVPTVVVVAVYYTLCDLLLLFQVYYYRRYPASPSSSSTPTSTDPLVPTPAPVAASRRRSSSHPTESSPLLAPPHPQLPPRAILAPWLEYPLLLLFVCAAGVIAWSLSPVAETYPEPGDGLPSSPADGEVFEWKSQTLGWISAALYLGSRVPQIAHNYKTRCAGLSLAMFFFSITGNVTYVLSITLKSLAPHYLLANFSWLVGSGGTIFLDLFVLGQFLVFSWQDKRRLSKGEDGGSEDGMDGREEVGGS